MSFIVAVKSCAICHTSQIRQQDNPAVFCACNIDTCCIAANQAFSAMQH
jgi:hypothetical protein